MNSTKHITLAVICHDGQPYGAQQSLWILLKNLPQDQYKILVSLAKAGPFEEMLKTLPNVSLTYHKRIQWIKHRPSFGLTRVFDCINLGINVITRTPKLISWLRQNQVSIIHINSTVSMEGLLAGYFSRIPTVQHIRELMTENNPRFTPLLGKKITQGLIKILPNKIIVISKAVLNNYPQLKNNNKVALIYNAIDSNSLMTQVKTWQPILTLGYVGRISNTKRFDQVLEACKILKDKKIAFKLKIAGLYVDEIYQKTVENFIKENQLENNVELIGFLNPITPFYKDIDLLLFPSTHDSFGRSVIEAMEFGVIPIAPNVQALPEIIESGKNGFLYSAENTTELVENILEVEKNIDLKNKLSSNAINTVQENFSAQSMVKKVQQLYEELLD